MGKDKFSVKRKRKIKMWKEVIICGVIIITIFIGNQITQNYSVETIEELTKQLEELKKEMYQKQENVDSEKNNEKMDDNQLDSADCGRWTHAGWRADRGRPAKHRPVCAANAHLLRRSDRNSPHRGQCRCSAHQGVRQRGGNHHRHAGKPPL